MKKQFLFFAILLIGYIPFSYAGNTGKIAGKVIDARTKEPLVGVNVVISGTSSGAATNIDGEYTILNLSPNTFSLRASLLGYNPVTVNNIKVSIDLTTRQDFELTETVVEQKEVVITAERPLVQKDMTATTAVVGKDLISELAVTEVRDVIRLQAGMAVSSDGQLHLRGGRSGQIAYQIDGVNVTDAYDNSNTIDVGANVVQELQVVSGAFNAEYGQAMSGLVNIVTKDGGDQLSGAVTAYAGNYFTNRSNLFWNVSDNLWNTSDKTPVAIQSYEGSLSGPIVPDKLSFYATGRYYFNKGYLYGRRVFLPTDLAQEVTTDQGTQYVITQNGDSSFVSMNPNQRIYGQGKLSYKLMSNLKIGYNYIFDDQQYRDYDHSNRLTPDNNLHRFRRTNSNILTINHAISAKSFYNLSLSYLYKDYHHYLFEDIYTGNPAYPTWYVNNDDRKTPAYSFNIGGTNMNRFNRNTGTYAAKIDWTTQITEQISLQSGGEFKQHRIYYHNLNLVKNVGVVPFTVTIPSIGSSDNTEYLHTPNDAAIYAQSKFESQSLIFNLGIRLDEFNPDGKILSDPTDPDINAPQNPAHQSDSYEKRLTYWYKNATIKTRISPRVGLAFPISAGGVVHFSYGHFFQFPNYELLYTNPDYKFGIGSGNEGLVGNADLKPQRTIKGEIGLKQQVTEDIAIDGTIFFEDFRDLIGTQTNDILVFTRGFSYSQYANSDFGYSKGIVLKVDKRFSSGFAASLDYTYSITNGNASNPADTRNAIVGGATPETYIAPLDWDQRHSLNLIVAYTKSRDYGCSIIANFASGQPYTPAVNKNSAVKQNAFPKNSAYKPTTFNVDLKANKDFTFGSSTLSVFLRVFNLLDLDNPHSVYGNSGDPSFTFDKLDAEKINPTMYYNTLDQLYENPTFYSEPRRFEIGTSISF
jgi:outer membrane receptor protein involved in Fe transport